MKTFWKIIKYVVLPIIILIVVALFYVSIGFSKLEFKDDFQVSAEYSSYYPTSYELARENFRESSNRIAETYQNVQRFEIRVPSKTDNDLTVGVCYVPAQKESTNLLILSSGVHGLEGYVGHAALELFIQKFLTSELLENTGVLLIHSVNPFGFKYTRRVTENNVDINRNCASTDDLYNTVNQGYPKVYGLINPQKKANATSLENRFFFIKAINEIRKASLPVLRQAVLQGQYQYPEGLYFGGQKTEPQIDSLKPIIAAITAPYRKIMAIDFHTGYGERGVLHFFPNPLENEKRQKLEKLYEGYPIDWGDSDDFYTVTGDFVGFIGEITKDKEYYPMLFEYGTLNSQTTMGSMKSIHVMIIENQGFQHGFASQKDSLKAKQDLMEMYFPESERWRNYIMEKTHEVFTNVLPRFVQNNN
jgi:hypothetical protein